MNALATLLAVALSSAPASVVDEAEVFSAAEAGRLDQLLNYQEGSAGVEVVVATWARPIGDAEGHSRRIANLWQVGRHAEKGGILIAYYRDTRQVQVQLSDNVPRLSNSETARIIDEEMIPRFREGEVAAGVERGVEALVAGTKGGFGGGSGGPRFPTRGLGSCSTIALVLMLIPFVARGMFFGGGYGSRHRHRGFFSGGFGSSRGGGFSGRGAGGSW